MMSGNLGIQNPGATPAYMQHGSSNGFKNFGMATAAGGIGAGLAGLLFSDQPNPYDAASGYLNQIPGATQPYYKPYMGAGQQALGTLQGQYGQLVNNPNSILQSIGSGYHESPGYQWQLHQAMGAADNAAASGGMLGTPQHQQQAATMASGLANQDYYNYLHSGLGLYGTGLEGLQGISNQGFNASDQMARIMADQLSNQGQLAYAGQAAQNQAQGSEMGDIFGSLASLASLAAMA